MQPPAYSSVFMDGQLLREQPGLDLFRVLHFLGNAPLRLDALGNLLAQANALQRHARLARYGSQQVFIVARIRLLGEANAQYQ